MPCHTSNGTWGPQSPVCSWGCSGRGGTCRSSGRAARRWEGRPFLLLLLALVPTTVLFTWVFNHTQGSVLLAILLHATHNLAGPDLPRPEEGFFTPFLLVTGLKWMLAVLVLVADPRVGLRGGPVPAGAAAAPV
jgi:membrane protease YdiL (CAAX protease family)